MNIQDIIIMIYYQLIQLIGNNGYQFAAIWQKFSNKPYIMSVAGINKGDNITIIKNIQNNNYIDFIELNLSCPNIIGKPQIAGDFEELMNY